MAPLNAPLGGQALSGVQPGTTSPVVTAQYVIVFGTGGGVFVYSGTPGPGNSPIAWMTSATSDPYGNSVVPEIGARDIATGRGTILHGSQAILLNSHAYNISGHQSDAYITGIPATSVSGQSAMYLLSPTDDQLQSLIQMLGQSEDTSQSPLAAFLTWDNAASSVSAALDTVMKSVAAVHPGTTTVETWQSISLTGAPAGTTGYARCKMVAEKTFACIDIEISYTALGAQASFTIGSLPSAAYYPQVARHLAAGIAGTATGSPQARLFLPTSSGVQLVDLPAGSSGFGVSVMYPLD